MYHKVCEICVKNISNKNYEKLSFLKLFLEKSFPLQQKGTWIAKGAGRG